MPFPYDVYTIQACNSTGIRLRKLILGKRTHFPHWYPALHQSPHWRENQRFDPLFSIPQNLPPGTPMFRNVDNLSYRQNQVARIN